MTEEIKYLDLIRKHILTVENFSGLLEFSHNTAIPEAHSQQNWQRHMHELVELRLLFAHGPNESVDYNQLQQIRITPPRVIHGGLEIAQLPRHITLRIGADELYYVRGRNVLASLTLNQAAAVPGVNYTELAAALECASAQTDPEHIRILIALLISVLRHLLESGNVADSSPAEVIAAYIRANYYRSDLSIREIAEITHFSPNYIQKVFRAGYNCTPVEYLNEVRLNAARLLLKQHRYQVKEVAAMCGWNYVHYFCRRYKEHFNKLPGAE